MAPPQGLALSSFLSNRTVSTPFSWAKISAAQAPDGPPPTTATLYFMSRDVADEARWATGAVRTKEDGAKAEAAAAMEATAAMVNFIFAVSKVWVKREWVMGIVTCEE